MYLLAFLCWIRISRGYEGLGGVVGRVEGIDMLKMLTDEVTDSFLATDVTTEFGLEIHIVDHF